MSTYIPKEENSYSQKIAHCNGYQLKKCESCFRLYLKEQLGKMKIERPSVLKPIFHKENNECMMYVDIKDCVEEVRNIESIIDRIEKEKMLAEEKSPDTQENEIDG